MIARIPSLLFCLMTSGLLAVSSAAVQAPPLAEVAPAKAPGLSLTFTTADGKTDTRPARLVALAVPAGTAPTPFLQPGAFTAKWEGVINSALRASYTFSAVGSGDFQLSINGQPVLDSAAQKPGDLPGKKVQLNKGENLIVAELKSPAQGDTGLQLFWASREFPPEPVPPSVFSHHSNTIPIRTSERIRQGRMLFAQMRCAACHAGGDALPPVGEGMPELAHDAPLFDELGAKYNEAWLAHWINDPHDTRPHALMPKVFASKPGEVAQEAADLAAYFAALGARNDKPVDEALAVEGGALFANLGCITCHSKPDAEGADEHQRVPLGHVKAKWQAPALAAYLKDPTRNYKWSRMPHFRLDDAEAARLTAYLLTTAKREFPAPPKGDASRGGPLLVSANCLNCHAGMPAMTTPKLEATLAGGWTKGCMAPDEATRGKAPDFRFTPEQRGALLAFAGNGFGSLKQDTAAEFTERQIANMRCTACHSRDTVASAWTRLDDEMAPLQAAVPPVETEGHPTFSSAVPPLTWLGEKLHTKWMAGFIAGNDFPKPRPWLIGRMPGFPAIGESMALGLTHQHGLSAIEKFDTPKADLAKTGEILLGENGGFNCTSCHGVGERGATAVFEAPGINLAYTPERLRHQYYLRWVLFPQRIDPDTKMPRFSDDEGKTPLTDHLEGNASAQFDSIWHYLHSLKK